MYSIERTIPVAAACFVLVVVAPAFAQYSECESAKQIKGPVSVINISEVKISLATGDFINTRRPTEKWTFESDRRRLTIVKYQREPFSQGYPTHVCDFDRDGRITRDTTLLDGRTVFETLDFRYDSQGRLVARMMRSRNPDRTYTIAYEHSDGIIIERSPWGGYVVTHLDAQGEIAKEITHRIGSGGAESVTTKEYERSADEIKACWSGAEAPGCSITTLDRWGNVLEGFVYGTGFSSRSTNLYEVDAHGNWTKKISPISFLDAKATKADVLFRDIEYRER